MNNEDRMRKLDNGTDTARWAAYRIRKIEAENKQLKDIILMTFEEYNSEGELSTKLCLEVAAMVCDEVIE